MKLFRMICLTVLTALCALIGSAQEQRSGEPPAPPRLAIESFTHDFGEVKSGMPLRFSFKIKNNGGAALEIKSVAPG